MAQPSGGRLFARDNAARFLPWVTAFMVYLAFLALSAVLGIHNMVDSWNAEISGTATVQIPPESLEQGVPGETVDRVLDLLEAQDGILSVEVLSVEEAAGLLEPWLGTGEHVLDLPLPRLIDVRLDPARADMQTIARELRAVAPQARLDDHRVWLQNFIDVVRWFEIAAVAIFAIVLVVTILTVMFTTRTGLAIHRDVVEILHLVGAKDSYIARKFGARALWLGLRGGIIGSLFAAATVYGFSWLASSIDAALLPKAELSIASWAILTATPFLISAIAWATARATVYTTLRQIS
ncbi:MAG: cell division protein [Rhodospirillales bacterium]